MRGTIVLLALLVALAAAEPGTRAQEGPQEPPSEGKAEDPGAQPAEPQAPPSDVPPGNVYPDPNVPILPPSAYARGEKPPAKEKVYPVKLKKMWKVVLDVVTASGAPVETADEAAGYIKTAVIEFGPDRFDWKYVATYPPMYDKKDYPIANIGNLYSGKFAVEVQLMREGKETRVSVRPYIEGAALHFKAKTKVWVERWSNGVIEEDYFQRIDKALGAGK